MSEAIFEHVELPENDMAPDGLTYLGLKRTYGDNVAYLVRYDKTITHVHTAQEAWLDRSVCARRVGWVEKYSNGTWDLRWSYAKSHPEVNAAIDKYTRAKGDKLIFVGEGYFLVESTHTIGD